MTSREVYRFNDFTLDVSERRLSRGGRTVPLAPKAQDVLLALVRNAGRLVTKGELLELVWPECFVEEGILTVHVSGLRRALGDANRSPQYIETVPRSGYRFIAAVSLEDQEVRGSTAPWSIAVLPAQPITPNGTDDERSIGLALADAVIGLLGRFNQIVVRPIRAVHLHTSGTPDLAAIGRSLQVDGVVHSRFDNTADRFTVMATLTRSRDGACVWSGEFDETGPEGPAIPEAVVHSLAAHLGLELSRAGGLRHETQLARGPVRPANTARVYELLGRGRFHLLSASMFEVPKAVAAFRAATELDPTYAAAHAGLALACCAQAELRVATPLDAYREARAAALGALAMDDSCADAQVALGAVLFLSEWNWAGAQRSLTRALTINPNHTEGYLLYGRLLEALGRLQEGLDMKLRALERDPLSPLVHLQLAMSYWNQRRYDESVEWATRTLDLDPRHLGAREFLAGAYLMKGDVARYMAENLIHAESHGVAAEVMEPFKRAYATGGRAGIVQYSIRHFANPAHSAPALQLALLYGEAGNLDTAFTHLDRAIDGRDPCLVHLAVAPQWDHLRADPRFDERLARMGLNTG